MALPNQSRTILKDTDPALQDSLDRLPFFPLYSAFIYETSLVNESVPNTPNVWGSPFLVWMPTNFRFIKEEDWTDVTTTLSMSSWGSGVTNVRWRIFVYFVNDEGTVAARGDGLPTLRGIHNTAAIHRSFTAHHSHILPTGEETDPYSPLGADEYRVELYGQCWTDAGAGGAFRVDSNDQISLTFQESPPPRLPV